MMPETGEVWRWDNGNQYYLVTGSKKHTNGIYIKCLTLTGPRKGLDDSVPLCYFTSGLWSRQA